MKREVVCMVTIILMASCVGLDAMVEQTLPEKLGILKTSLQTLQEKLETLTDNLEDLKEDLETDNNEYEESGPSLRELALKWAEERCALEDGEAEPPAWVLEQDWSWTPDFQEEESQEFEKGTLETIIEALKNYAQSADISWLSKWREKAAEQKAVYLENVGEPISVYIQTKDAEGMPHWQRMHVRLPQKISIQPPDSLPSNAHVTFEIGANTLVIRDVSSPPVSRYDTKTLKSLDSLSVEQWRGGLKPKFYGVDTVVDQTNILSQYEYYRFPNFIAAARSSLRIYDAFMLALQRKIDTDESFRRAIASTPGFECSWWSGSKFLDLIRNETDTIIKNRCARHGCLDVRDKKCIKKLAAERKQKNRDISSKDPDKRRLKRRLKVLEEVLNKRGDKLIDYSWTVKQRPAFADPYANVFDHQCGTILDKELHEDLCDTRVMMLYLQEEYQSNPVVQSYAPIINRMTALAKLEKDVEKAFSLADFSYDVVSIVSSCLTKAAKATLDPRTYVDATIGVLQLGVFLAQGGEPMDDFDIATQAAMFPEDKDTLFKVSDEYHERCKDQAQAAQETYVRLKEEFNAMTWQEKATVVGDVVAPLVLAWGIPRIAALAGSASGCRLVSNLAKVMKSAQAEEALAGIGAVEKIAVQEGVGIARVTNEVMKHNPGLLEQKGKQISEVVREIAKDVVETKDFGKVAYPDGSRCWLKLSEDELKKIGPRSAQTDIRAVKGTAQDAWDFFTTQVESYVESVRAPGVFIGKSANGIEYSYRAASNSGPPTIGIGGVKGLRKIKFLE